jgi:hypothetical protein
MGSTDNTGAIQGQGSGASCGAGFSANANKNWKYTNPSEAGTFKPDTNVQYSSGGKPFDSQGIPIGANGLRPNEYWNYQTGQITGPYDNPNTWYKPENFIPTYRGGEQYANNYQEYDMEKLLQEMQSTPDTSAHVQVPPSLDLNTLGTNFV